MQTRLVAAALKLGLVGAILALAGAATAEPLAAGAKLSPFALTDQHDVTHRVDASTRVILFSRDMAGGKLLKEALADASREFLASRGAVYVADISGMPTLVAKLMALPAMRKRPYPVLLDRNGSATAQLPDLEGHATLIFCDALTIDRIEHAASAAEVLRALEP